MEHLLWHLLAGTRGGFNRIRIINLVLDRPANANQISTMLNLDYRTVRYHLGALTQNVVLVQPTGASYGAPYFPSKDLLLFLPVFQKIKSTVCLVNHGEIMEKADNPSMAGTLHGYSPRIHHRRTQLA